MDNKLIRHEVKVKTQSLEALPGIARDNLIRELFSLGNQTKKRLHSIMREDLGGEKRSVKLVVNAGGHISKGTLTFRLSVYSTLIQALVDETGAKPHFPPWKRGSKLYKWAERHGLFRPKLLATQARALGQLAGRGAAKDFEARRLKENERTVFLVARAQSRRGLPRPGDPLRKPWEKTANTMAGFYSLAINADIAKSIREANQIV